MTDINDLMPKRFFNADDILSPRVLTIIRVERVNTAAKDKEAEIKAAVYFENEERGVVLNGERRDTLVDLYGRDTDNWLGQSVEIFRGETKFGGKKVGCVSFRAPAK